MAKLEKREDGVYCIEADGIEWFWAKEFPIYTNQDNDKPSLEQQLQEVRLSNKMQEVKLELINDALVEGGLL